MFSRQALVSFLFVLISVMSTPSFAEVLFQTSLADGSRPNPINGTSGYEIDYNLNGSCWSAGCFPPLGISPNNTYAADNFTLTSTSTLSSLTFTGIRTGATRFDDVVGVARWRVYQDEGTFLNSYTPSEFGALVANGASILANGVGREINGQYFRDYTFNFDTLSLAAGSYFVALHLDIFGDSHQADDTTVYLANGYGSGVQAINSFSNDWSDLDREKNFKWISPNSDVVLGGIAMVIEGTALSSVDVPEPGSAALILIGGAAILWRRRKSLLESN
jgi:hypothetical protein